MQTLWQDLRYAARTLAKNPGFAIVAALTLAVAIGANAVVFSVLNALIWHPPLHVPKVETLYGLQHGDEPTSQQSYPDYIDLRDRNHSFDGLAAYGIDQAALDVAGDPSPVWVEEVSANYFDVLDIRPHLGRFFHPSDELGWDSAPYVVLSYSYWHTRFHDDRKVIGRTVQLNKHPFTVLGVAQPGFHGTLVFFNPEVFIPIVNSRQIEGGIDFDARGNRWIFMTMGRLKPGVTVAQATADLNSIGAYLEKAYPKDDEKRTFALVRPSLYGDFLGRPVRAFMTGLMLLASLILLAACANLGSLFAARAADRSRELALRLALGASRTRLLRQLFTEAVLLSVVGGAVGLWFSAAMLSALSVWQPFSRWPIRLSVNPDAYVYAVALLLTLVSGFLFGAVPIKQIFGMDSYGIIKSGSLVSPARRITVRDFALGLQIAICAVLVTSSLVAMRGLSRSMHSNFGFEPRGTLVLDTELHMAGYHDNAEAEMQKHMIDAVGVIPGVRSVGLINTPPLVSSGYSGALVFHDETSDFRQSKALFEAFQFRVSPEYLRAAETRLLSGRSLTWHDDKNASRVAVVNQEFARRVFGSPEKAIEKYFKESDGSRTQIVGIVQDGRYGGIAEDPQPAMYVPILQAPTGQTSLVIRSNDPLKLSGAIRSAVHALDPALSIHIETWEHALGFALFPSRMAAIALGVMGAMGAILSVTGVFGLAAYSVSKRLRELGIRIALGAQRKEILRAALGRAFKLLACGSAIGLLLGILASRVLASIVYQATSRDPLVLSAAVLAMAFLGLAATSIPAHRALKVDPAILLREE